MRVCTLSSGSNGNAVYIQEGSTHLLVDAGISLRALRNALADLGVAIAQLGGLLVTHAHEDHVRGVEMLAKHTDVPIFGSRHALLELLANDPDLPAERLTVFSGSGVYDIGEVAVTPFTVSHDAHCYGYRIEGESAAFGVATDMGCVTEEVEQALSGVDFALIEANHDVEMVRTGPYPPFLKQRVLSAHGHLSNDDCAALACRLLHSGCRHFLLGHLSEQNNLPTLAASAVCGALSAAGAHPGDATVDVAPRRARSEMFVFGR